MPDRTDEERYRRLKLGIALDQLSMAELDLLERQLTIERSTDSLRSIFWNLPVDGLTVLNRFLETHDGREIVVRTIRIVLQQKEGGFSDEGA